MIAEVPLGAFLSGGVDSSAVVAAMANVSTDPVNTCSIAFADPAYDESRYAHAGCRAVPDAPFRRSGRERGFRPHRRARPHLRRALRRQLGDTDLPRLPACAQARNRGALGGRRGRELWRIPALPASPDGRADAVATSARRCDDPCSVCSGTCTRRRTGRRGSSARSRRSRRSGGIRSTAYFHGVSILRDGMRRRLFTDAFRAQLGGYNAVEVFHRHARKAGTEDPLALIQYLDLKTYLVGDINTKVDRASMAHSLEVREPLMDHPLVEWLATLAIVDESAWTGREVAAQEGDGAAACRARFSTGPRWASPCRSRDGFAARCASGCARHCWASGWLGTGFFDRELPPPPGRPA